MAIRVTGTFFLAFDDTNTVERDLLAVRNSELVFNVDGLEGGNPDGLDWKYSGPIMTEWSGSLVFNIDKTDDAPDITHSEIEALHFDRTMFAARFVAATGAIYSGTVFVSRQGITTADQQVATVAVTLRGSGALTIENPEDPCGENVEAGGQGTTNTDHFLGRMPGWVKLDYEMFTVADQCEILYNDVVVATTGGLVSGTGSLFYFYDPPGIGPFKVVVRMTAPTGGTAWNYTIFCPDPSNAP